MPETTQASDSLQPPLRTVTVMHVKPGATAVQSILMDTADAVSVDVLAACKWTLAAVFNGKLGSI